jgi:hydrogenase nickel incorporation protein HypA/HybF
MHEAGLMASVLDIVNDSRWHHGIDTVAAISLQVGELNGALPDALQFAFDALRGENPWLAQSVALQIVRTPPVIRCLECQYKGTTFSMNCPRCDSVLTKLLEGEEFNILGYDGELQNLQTGPAEV